MPRPTRSLCAWPVTLATVLLASGCGKPPPRHKVLLIGVDGVRPDVLAEVPTPNIDRLAVEGFYSPRAQTGLPTVSGPGWSSMLIGVWATKHGVESNDLSTNRSADYPDLFTRIEELRPELHTFVAADWLPLVDTTDGGPLLSNAIDLRVASDGYDLGWAEADQLVTDTAIAYLRGADPDAMFVYLGNPDEVSHHDKSIGEGYREAIATADRQIGALRAAVMARPTFGAEDWLILISTDHGRRSDGGHGEDSPEERTIFYLAHGPSVEADTTVPRIVDVAVTALAHLGLADSSLDGRVVGLRK